eukprot:11228284-Lingulodinium_polyedra.AAC.2
MALLDRGCAPMHLSQEADAINHSALRNKVLLQQAIDLLADLLCGLRLGEECIEIGFDVAGCQ